MCSSMSFGVTQIMCCPFQYFTILRAWRVLTISSWVILVKLLERGEIGKGREGRREKEEVE